MAHNKAQVVVLGVFLAGLARSDPDDPFALSEGELRDREVGVVQPRCLVDETGHQKSLAVSVQELEAAKEGLIVVVVLHEHFGDLSSLRFDERVLKFLFTVGLIYVGPRAITEQKLKPIVVVGHTDEVAPHVQTGGRRVLPVALLGLARLPLWSQSRLQKTGSVAELRGVVHWGGGGQSRLDDRQLKTAVQLVGRILLRGLDKAYVLRLRRLKVRQGLIDVFCDFDQKCLL